MSVAVQNIDIRRHNIIQVPQSVKVNVQDRNIRLSPTFPPTAAVQATVDAFVVCVQLASVRQRLG